MELVYYTVSSWLLVGYLITTIHKDEIVRSILVYFVFTFVSVCIFSLVTLNYSLVQFSDDVSKYLCLVLSKNIIVPCLTLIFINLYLSPAVYRKYIHLPILFLLIGICEFFNLRLQINMYREWVFYLVMITYAVSVFAAIAVSRFIIVLQLRGGLK